MTLKQARDRVEEIKRIAADDERAHGMEDDLRADVLKAIATGKHSGGHSGAVVLAQIALSTEDIEFARWCA
jgi:hypothetical protein